jgi:cytochrome c peroxidase
MRFTCSLLVASLFCSVALGQTLDPLEAIESKPGVAELGKRMFYDRRLSGDTSLSCS